MEELHLNDPDHNPTSSELLEHTGLERSDAKEREPGSTKMEPSRNSCEAVENSDESSENTIIQKKLFLLKKGNGVTFLPTNISDDILLKPKSPSWS